MHHIEPAYGYSRATVLTSGVLSASRRFLRDVSGTVSAGYYVNKSDAGQYSTQMIDERSVSIRPGIRWEATKIVTIDLSYENNRVDYRMTDTDADPHLAFLTVALRYPILE